MVRIEAILRLIDHCRVLLAATDHRIVGVLISATTSDAETVLHIWVPSFYENRLTVRLLLRDLERNTDQSRILLEAVHSDDRSLPHL